MIFGKICTYILLIFTVIGALDRCFGNKLGAGRAFEQGFSAISGLALSMIGVNTVAPLIAACTAPFLDGIYTAIGIDPSVFAGILLANDCGGWPLANSLAVNAEIGRFSGSVMASMMGCTLTFTIPYIFAVAPSEKRPAIAKGLCCGLITIPLGCLVGGFMMRIPILRLLLNLLPLLLFSALLIAGLSFAENFTLKCVTIFGRILTAVITLSLLAAIIVKQTGISAPLLVPFDESMSVIGGIAVTLTGAFTLLFFVKKLCGKLFIKIGKRVGLGENAVIGLVTSAVNSIPTFSLLSDMDERGVIINSAFAVSGAFVFGDHLAFTAGTDITATAAVTAAKLTAAATAVIIASVMSKRSEVG